MAQNEEQNRPPAEDARQQLAGREATISRLTEQLRDTGKDMASSMLMLVDLQNPAVASHCKRVARWARRYGAMCGMEEHDLDILEIAAGLHDIGLLASPMLKGSRSQPLNMLDEKFIRHPAIGYSLVSRIQGLEKAADAILHHHERYDGSGYPHKLWGERIPLFSRIIAASDLYDNQLHQVGGGLKTIDPEEARLAVGRERGKALDPNLTGKFLALLTSTEAAQRDDEREAEITPGALRSGMVLSRDVRSVDKILLLKAGTILTDEIIDRLFSSDQSDWLVTQVFVDSTSVKEDDLAPEARPEDRSRLFAATGTAKPQAKRLSILVLDDSIAVCSALRRELGMAGMAVTGATSVPDAIDLLKKHSFDAVVTDLVISSSGASGFELLRNVAANYPRLYCVVLSGFPTAENIRALRELNNVVRFVTKPWAQDVLMSALREAVDRGQPA